MSTTQTPAALTDAEWTTRVIAALEGSGYYSCRVWEDRIYIREGRKDRGYITVREDDGSTGTCKQVSASGHISRIIRDALA